MSNNPNQIHYNIKGSGLTISGEVRDYLDKKIPQIEKYLQGSQLSVLDIELMFDVGRADRKYRATFNIVADRHTLHTTADGDSLHEAIDIAVEELSREAAKEKTKRLDSVRKGAARIKDFFRGLRRRP